MHCEGPVPLDTVIVDEIDKMLSPEEKSDLRHNWKTYRQIFFTYCSSVSLPEVLLLPMLLTLNRLLYHDCTYADKYMYITFCKGCVKTVHQHAIILISETLPSVISFYGLKNNCKNFCGY